MLKKLRHRLERSYDDMRDEINKNNEMRFI